MEIKVNFLSDVTYIGRTPGCFLLSDPSERNLNLKQRIVELLNMV